MIGPKKLSVIRQELQHRLAALGNDPIRWLEERMAVPEHRGSPASKGSEVLDALRRIVEAPRTGKQRKQQIG